MELPVDQQFPILMKILSYDRSIKEKAGKSIYITIIYQSEYRGSLLARNEFLRAAGEGNPGQLGGIPLLIKDYILTDIDSLQEHLERERADYLYITPLRAVSIGSIVELANTIRIPTLTGVPEYCKMGVAISIDILGGKPKILVNLEFAKRQGLDLSSQLLRLVKLVN
jgi:hypothetical protein